MKFLFVCVPDAGHIHPLVPVAARLNVSTEHTVEFASMDTVRAKVEAHGLNFVSLGAFTPETAHMYAALNRTIFDAAAPLNRKLSVASTTILKLYGFHMSTALFAYLKGCSQQGLPDVIVTDSLSLAGYDAAEAFHIPLAVMCQYPLNQALLMAGLNRHNLPSSVPLESVLLNTSEQASPLTRFILNPVLKRVYAAFAGCMWNGPRNEVRAQLGLPPMAAGTGGLMAVQPGVPRVTYIVGASWELNVPRPLPDNVHLVGPTGIDYSSPGSFPPAFGAKDSNVELFLQQAQDAGEAVVYVATGTMVVLQPEQVAAMAAAFKTLAQNHKVRFLWSMKEDTQQMLPPELRTAASSSSDSSASSSRILVLPWFNQPAVLAHPRVKLFISHAGLGSTHEGLAAGVSILGLPFTADQPTLAQQLVNKGLGLKVNPSNLQAQQLVAAVQQLLAEPMFAENAAAVGAKLRSESGPQKAVDLLLAFAAAGDVQVDCTKGQ